MLNASSLFSAKFCPFFHFSLKLGLSTNLNCHQKLNVHFWLPAVCFAASVSSSSVSKVVSSFKCVNFWKIWIWWNESMRTYLFEIFPLTYSHWPHETSSSEWQRWHEKLREINIGRLMGAVLALAFIFSYSFFLQLHNFTHNKTNERVRKMKKFLSNVKNECIQISMIILFFSLNSVFFNFVALSLNKCLLALTYFLIVWKECKLHVCFDGAKTSHLIAAGQIHSFCEREKLPKSPSVKLFYGLTVQLKWLNFHIVIVFWSQ